MESIPRQVSISTEVNFTFSADTERRWCQKIRYGSLYPFSWHHYHSQGALRPDISQIYNHFNSWIDISELHKIDGSTNCEMLGQARVPVSHSQVWIMVAGIEEDPTLFFWSSHLCLPTGLAKSKQTTLITCFTKLEFFLLTLVEKHG